MDILIATTNQGKLREYRRLLADADVHFLSLDDVGLAELDVEETGDTFKANAELKAIAYAKASGKYALADDSGLCVDALSGEPGVYSARYGGVGLDDARRRHKLLGAMEAIPDDQRGAQFECVIAIAHPTTLECVTVRGVCRGRITRADADGPEGFGYDAIFMPDDYDITFAQFTRDEKNQISHRGVAAMKLPPVLKDLEFLKS
jgi:XTP/dITP diphosphohydrolase